ncbi:MAG: sigma-70 family RNA polymerase sigma factor [Ignavibacteriales bacterium]|nr:sigma-70 family RNA polymerase sigma factor [Ignavibacteriales bacterium]
MEKDNKLVRSLLFDARQGNNSAFEQLFNMNSDHIYTLVLRLTSSLTLAEKITKDVFLETWLHISSVRVDTSFNGWLIGISVFKILELFRNGELENIQKVKPGEIIPAIEKLSESHKNIEYAILTSINEEERIAFVLRYLEKYSFQESSDLFGVTHDKFQPLLNSAVLKIIQATNFEKGGEAFLELISKINYKLHPATEIWKQVSDEMVHYKSVRQGTLEEKIEAQRLVRAEEYEKDKQSLREELEKEEKRLLERKKKQSKRVRKPKKIHPLLSAAVLFFLIAIAYYFLSMQVKWSISNVSGTPKLNSTSLNGTESFDEGDLLVNNSVSEASLYISDVGSIFIKSDTKIKRIENDELYLLHGTISVMRTDAERFLTVKTSSMLIKDFYLNGDYELNADEIGGGSIECDYSWVILVKDKSEVIVPSKYKCEWQKNGRIGLPYSVSASDDFKKTIAGFDADKNDEKLFDKIINLSQKSDAPTLWNLLKLINSEERIIVINKLNELIPFPAGVNQNGLIDLEPKMMQLYLNEIEFRY